MTWTDFYLICFLVGLFLSAICVFSGAIHLPGVDFGHHGDFHFHLHADSGGAGGPHGVQQVSYFNLATLMAFLAWFGGTGYLLSRHGSFWGGWVVLLSLASGLVGATLVFLFISKFVMTGSHELDTADYDRVGVIAQVTSSIREGGTGEVVFVQENVRNVCGARSDTGAAVPKGTEVVITRYERGIAYVRKWEELEASLSSSVQTSREQ